MKKVVIDTDDFGYSSAVNLRIIKFYKEGILTSTTLVANMSGHDETTILAKEDPDSGVGGHPVLTCGKPLTKEASLVDGNGGFYSLAEYKKYCNKICDKETFREWPHRTDYLMDHGLQLAYLDSHHHVHSFPENLEVMERVAKKYHLCSRNVFELRGNIGLPNRKEIKGFLNLVNHPVIRDSAILFKENRARCLEEVQTVPDQAANNGITGLMAHPAYIDEILYFNSSFNIQ